MKLILIFAQAITQQEQIIGFFYEAIYMFFFGVITVSYTHLTLPTTPYV